MRLRWNKTLLYFFVGLGLIAVMTSFVGVGRIVSILQNTVPFFVGLGFIAASAHILLFAFNWYIVLDEIGYHIGLWKLIQVFYAGTFANNVTPLGQMGGEPIMAYILSNNSGVSYERSLAGIFSADAINALPFFTYSFIGITYFTLFYPTDLFVRMLAATVLVIAAAMIGLLALFWFRAGTALAIILGVGSRLRSAAGRIGWEDKGPLEHMEEDELRERLVEFRETIGSVFERRSLLLESMIVTHAAGLLNILALYAFLLAVGWKVEFFLLMLIVPMTVIAFYMPLPGGLGGVEVLLVTLLVVIAGVQPHVASAAVILHRSTVYLLPTLLGAGLLWHLSSGWETVQEGMERSGEDIV